MPSKSRTEVLKSGTFNLTSGISTYPSGGSPTIYPAFRPYENVRSEEITYGVGKQNYNDCYHTVTTRIHEPLPLYMIRFSSGSPYSIQTFPVSLALGIESSSPPLGPDNFSIDQFLMRAYQAARPKFASEFSAPNFLFELRDLRRMIPSLDQARALLALLATPRNLRQSTKEVLGAQRVLAEQHLNMEFGVLPMISDIFNLVDAVKLFNLKLDLFRKDGKKKQTAYFKQEITPGKPIRTFVSRAPQYRLYYEDDISECTLRSAITYSYDIRLPKISIPKIFLKYIGIRNNPRIIWDALPFSFLVDWVFQVGKALESWDEGAIPVDVKIHHWGYSVKWEGRRQYTVDSHLENFFQVTLGQNVKCGLVTHKSYTRKGLSPDAISHLVSQAPLPQLRGLTQRQLLLGASLGRTRLRG